MNDKLTVPMEREKILKDGDHDFFKDFVAFHFLVVAIDSRLDKRSQQLNLEVKQITKNS